MRRKKVAIFTTHPIQYQVPWFQALSKCDGYDFKIFYSFIPDEKQQGDGFGVDFRWDIPLFEDYEWVLLTNRRKEPSLSRFAGSIIKHPGRVLRQEKPDVLLLTGWNSLTLVQALLAAKRLGIPALVRGDSNALKPRSIAVKSLHRIFMRLFNGFLAVGYSNRDFYLGNGVDAKDIFSVPHFIDNDRFHAVSKELASERNRLRAHWQIQEDSTCFLFAGKLIEKKRIRDLLEAFKIAFDKESSLSFLVVGDGDQMQEARHFVDTHQLPVTFAGFMNQTEIPRAYVAADCLVLPSDHGETWGLVVNEAMACGLPAIVSDRVGCGPDLVKSGETGYTFPFGDTSALADKMCLVAKDRQRTRAMGASARELVMSEYSIQRAVEGTLLAIEAVT